MIRLRVLGVLDLRTGDDAEIRQVLAQPKRAALLTYLVLASPRGSHPRDRLLALFWPEQALEQARNALSQAVHFLRRALGDDVIVSNNDTLTVAPSTTWCDAIAFDDAIREGRLADALELYRGDFLEGFHVANAPELERWLDAERQRIAERFDAALESTAAQREQRGDYAGALTLRRKLAARAPYNSAVALRLMRALAASGDPAAALQQALVHEKLLRAELDLALPADISAFCAEIQARPPAFPANTDHATEPGIDTPSRTHPEASPAARKAAADLWPAGWRRRVALLTVALVTACVGVAYAVVNREAPDDYLMQLYRRGQDAEVNRSQVGLQTAAQYYRLAIERDSGFALGYAGLSRAFTHMAFYDFAPKVSALDSARVLAEKAVALDSALSETKAVLALSLANSGHFAAAEREFRAAIVRDPGNTNARLWYGMLLVARGRGAAALAQVDTILKLEPVPPRAAHNVRMQATYLMTGQRPHLKLPTAERRPILKAEPGEPWARAQQAVELAEEGRCGDARSELAIARRLVPDSNMQMLTFVGLIHWSCGEHADAHALLAKMKQRPNAQERAMRIAILHTRFGEIDSAFVWLGRERWSLSALTVLRGNPWLDPLRSDQRFPQLLRSIGLQ